MGKSGRRIKHFELLCRTPTPLTGWPFLISILLHVLLVTIILRMPKSHLPTSHFIEVNLSDSLSESSPLKKQAFVQEKHFSLPKMIVPAGRQIEPISPSAPTQPVAIVKSQPDPDALPFEGLLESSGVGVASEGIGVSHGDAGGSKSPLPFYIPLVKVTQMPIIKKSVPPIYPENAKRLGKEGVVTVEVGISETGVVVDVRVIQGLGFGFDEAAVVAMKQSVFTPAQVGNTPVAVKVYIPVRFRFKD